MNDDRVQLKSMLEQLNNVEVILAMDIDRLTRNNVLAEQIKIEIITMKLNNLQNTEPLESRYTEIINTLDRLNELPVLEVNEFLKTIIKRIEFGTNTECVRNKHRKVDEDKITLEVEFL